MNSNNRFQELLYRLERLFGVPLPEYEALVIKMTEMYFYLNQKEGDDEHKEWVFEISFSNPSAAQNEARHSILYRREAEVEGKFQPRYCWTG